MTEITDALRKLRTVNAYGPVTRLSGNLYSGPREDVMELAFRTSYDVADLQELASDFISAETGAEAAIVTAGASAGLLLAAAACIARQDASVMDVLPATAGLANEIIIARPHRNAYDHALRAAGAVFREIGIPDRVSGAGVRDVEIWEYEAAISDRTVAIAYVAGGQSAPSLTELSAIAHARGVPVIVDAAAQLPPKDNLSRFIRAGADLVIFSGGKAIGGPQASGILCGRRDLIASALLQNLDVDVDMHDRKRLLGRKLFRGLDWRGFPHHGIGRSSKVSKENIVPFLLALEQFVRGGDAAFIARQKRLCDELATALSGRNDLRCQVLENDPRYRYPVVEITLAADRQDELGALRTKLAACTPPIAARFSEADRLLLCLIAVRDEDVRYIAESILADAAMSQGQP